jgi:hypothetical protein
MRCEAGDCKQAVPDRRSLFLGERARNRMGIGQRKRTFRASPRWRNQTVAPAATLQHIGHYQWPPSLDCEARASCRQTARRDSPAAS